MRKKYKDLQQKIKNKINDDRKDLNTIQIIQNQNDNEELDNLNNLKKRNTISHFPERQVFRKKFLFLKNLESNDNKAYISQLNKNIDINEDKRHHKFKNKKNYIKEIEIKVNKPSQIRNKLYINNTETILKTDPNVQIKLDIDDNDLNDYENIQNKNLENINVIGINKFDNLNQDYSNNNSNIKKIQVNLIKNRKDTKNNTIKREDLKKYVLHNIDTDINIIYNTHEINNNIRRSNGFSSSLSKYKTISSKDNLSIDRNSIYKNQEEIKNSEFNNYYINTKTSSNSRNKIKKNPFKFLVHNAIKNNNLSETFNRMYNSYKVKRSNSNNNKDDNSVNKYSTIDQKSNTNSSSAKEKNNDLNSIAKILSDYENEKIKKRHFKILNYKSKGETNSNQEINIKTNEEFNIDNKIVNNNTYNTTFNIYKINNIIPQKESNSNNKRKSSKIFRSIEPNIQREITESNNEKEKYKEIKENVVLITNTNLRNSDFNKKINDDSPKINLANFYSFNSKNKEILNNVNNYKSCYNEINDLIQFFFENNIYESLIKYFKIVDNKKIINNMIKISMLCYYLCYDSSFYQDYSQAGILFKTIFNILNKNFLIILSYILNNFVKINDFNIINKLLYNDLNLYIKKELDKSLSDYEIYNENYLIKLIEKNYKQMANYYKLVIENLYNYNLSKKNNLRGIKDEKLFRFPDCLSIDINNLNKNQKLRIISLFFFDSFLSLNNFNLTDLKVFYDIYLKKEIKNNEIVNNKKVMNYQQFKNGYFRLLNTNYRFNKSSKNYLPPMKSIYKYSLLINLDALIYDPTQIYKGKFQKVHIRPGLIQFLKQMKKIYELILFSNNDFEYISNILKYFEIGENKFFENILSNYKINIKYDNSVENFDLLGRNINNVIIIDKAKSSCKITNNNIIYIKPYYGNVNNDNNILLNLLEILKKLRTDFEEINDIGIVLGNYRYSIFTKISNFLL